MLLSKKGAALLQVLLVTAILAGLASLLLRVSIARANSSRGVRRLVSSQVLIESCATEVNMFWAAKKPETFARDIDQCIMYCKHDNVTDECPSTPVDARVTEYHCKQRSFNSINYDVTATISNSNTAAGCKITYTIESNAKYL